MLLIGSRRHRVPKTICLLAALLVVYNEFLIYFVAYLSWPKRHVDNNGTSFLLVADPQLIGERDEPLWYGWLARWDSDRYLHNTYMLANSYVQPDVVAFLGDLFDEGLKANDEQYARYFSRFQAVFQLGKALLSPSDLDIS